MTYNGEHLLPGTIGQGFIWVSLVSLVVSALLFLPGFRGRNNALRIFKTAQALFLVHFAALLGAMAALYYIIGNHYFEYSYVWQYSSKDLPVKFLISCFWAGQEGSFLIWAFFQGLLGIILLYSSREWKNWVMPVYATGQLFLLTMVLGAELFGLKIGGSPFALLREMPQNQGLGLFRDPDYLKMITDGNGLNPLLENIWMIIHPPALFLGYAVSFLPFTYAIASLWRKEYQAWLKPALKWTLAALLTLGFGILLGGRWAYESLTFGGFWAWDPVENASLVPWLFLVAALHMMIIAFKRQHSYSTTYLFTILVWVMVVYATYLTRSGVLGETSVHSFGDSGKALQMLIFNAIFLVFPIILVIIKRKDFPKKDADELLSREFWMLIGSVIVVLSAFQVIITTSVPALNKIFSTNIAPPTDNVGYYNTWQLPFALLVGLLISVSQFMVYGKTQAKPFWRKIMVSTIIAFVLTVFFSLSDHITRFDHAALLFGMMLVTVVSIEFIIKYFKRTNNVGASLTHAGFAIFMIGVILAFSNSRIISKNTSGFDLGKEEDNAENLVLFKGRTQPMGNYFVTYSSQETKGRETFYRVDFVKKTDSATGKIAFSVFPSVNRNMRMGNVYNPDTKHFIGKDIYTYISFAQQSEGQADSEGYVGRTIEEMDTKDTVVFSRSFVILDTIDARMEGEDISNISIRARFKILSMQHGRISATIGYRIVNGELVRDDAIVEPLGLKIRFEGVSGKSHAIRVGFYEKNQDFIVIKAVIFPFMIVLWGGSVIMFGGLILAIYRRVRKTKTVIQPL
jgi:cytochrome c-type biogenesis protein CcmF